MGCQLGLNLIKSMSRFYLVLRKLLEKVRLFLKVLNFKSLLEYFESGTTRYSAMQINQAKSQLVLNFRVLCSVVVKENRISSLKIKKPIKFQINLMLMHVNCNQNTNSQDR